MIRILLLVALALTLAPSLGGCDDLTEEEKALTQRRTPPPPRPAPGTELGGGMSGDSEDGDDGAPPDPNAGG